MILRRKQRMRNVNAWNNKQLQMLLRMPRTRRKLMSSRTHSVTLEPKESDSYKRRKLLKKRNLIRNLKEQKRILKPNFARLLLRSDVKRLKKKSSRKLRTKMILRRKQRMRNVNAWNSKQLEMLLRMPRTRRKLMSSRTHSVTLEPKESDSCKRRKLLKKRNLIMNLKKQKRILRPNFARLLLRSDAKRLKRKSSRRLRTKMILRRKQRMRNVNAWNSKRLRMLLRMPRTRRKLMSSRTHSVTLEPKESDSCKRRKLLKKRNLIRNLKELKRILKPNFA